MASEQYHVEFKTSEGEWRPAYGSYSSKALAENAKRDAMDEIEADTGKKQKKSEWRVASGPGKSMSAKDVAWGQWAIISAALGFAWYFFIKD